LEVKQILPIMSIVGCNIAFFYFKKKIIATPFLIYIALFELKKLIMDSIYGQNQLRFAINSDI